MRRVDEAELLDLGVGLTGQDGVDSPTGSIRLEASVVQVGLLRCTRTDPGAKFNVAILPTDGEKPSCAT